MTTRISSAHLELDELQRILDNECDISEHTYAVTHLRTCSQCAAELRTLEQQAALVRGWLQQAAFEDGVADEVASPALLRDAERGRIVPMASRRKPALLDQSWLRVAAVLVLLATPVAASSDVRGWIAQRLGLAPVEPVNEVIADPDPASARAGGVIRFVPAAGSFELFIASRQQAGTLEIVAGEQSDAVLQIDGAVGAGPIVSEHELRIHNESTSTASYRLRVPANVTRVVVRIAGEKAQQVEGVELREGVRLLLGN